MEYNANRELKDYNPKQGGYMAEARRKTTFEERKEIVSYCISHSRNYKDAAIKYDVSYSQVYSWVKKYDAAGEAGLTDKRGHHKTDDEVDELERLKCENLRLKRQLEERDMAVELLKKVKGFGFWGIIKAEMYQMYEIADESSLRYTIKDYLRFYSEERPRDRYHCKTPSEVREEALASDAPIEYPVPENKRIMKYKEKWCV